MDFGLSEQQALLGESVGRYLAQHYAFPARRVIAGSAEGYSPAVWRALASDLGLLSLVGEPGAAPDPVDVMVVMEQAGAALLVEPLVETVVVAGGLLRQTGDMAALARIAAGEEIWAFGWGEPTSRYRLSDVATRARRDGEGWVLDGAKSIVTAAPWATRLIVTARTADAPSEAAGVSLFVIEPGAPGVSLSPYRTIDGRRAADVVLDDVRIPAAALLGPEGGALQIVEQVADEAIAALCAEAVGIMRRLHRDTAEYLRQRQQFGRALFEFQALQHRLVEMLMRIELATSATYRATMALGAAPAERARAVSGAKAVVDDAARFVGENAVQLHGGMGMTDELPVGHCFKRLLAIGMDFGNRDHHLARYAALSAA